MTIRQIAQDRQQQRIADLTQRGQGKAHVNPYGTPGMSLNDAGDFRKTVPVDEGVVSTAIKNYAMSLSPEKRLSASWTLNEIFHNEAVRLGEFVRQHDPSWDWGKPFDTGILEGYRQGVDTTA